MTETLLSYVIIGAVIFLAVFSFVIGISQMIKVILGNYILSTICLAATQSLDILVNFFRATPELKALGMSYDMLATFFANGKTTIVLILYAVLLIVIYQKSSINIKLPEDEAIQKALYIILVPLTVFSMILALQICILGVSVIDMVKLQEMADSFLQSKEYLYQFLRLTPVWMLLHGLITVLITSEMKVSIKTDI